MNSTLQQVAEKIPFVGSYLPPLPQPGVTYQDPSSGTQTGEQSLTVNSLEALEDIHAASEVLGLAGLAFAVRERVDEARSRDETEEFKPVEYKGQGAIAIRRVLEDGAEQSVNKSKNTSEPQLSPDLAKRVYALNKAAQPRHIGRTALDKEMMKLVAGYRKMEAPSVIDQGTGWDLESYTVFKDTDPKRSDDTQVRRGPLVKL